MKRVRLGPEPLCRRAQRVVGYMRIMLCRARVGVAEEAPDDLKVEAARNEVGSMGMPIVVQAIVRNARLLGDCLPELLDVLMAHLMLWCLGGETPWGSQMRT